MQGADWTNRGAGRADTTVVFEGEDAPSAASASNDNDEGETTEGGMVVVVVVGAEEETVVEAEEEVAVVAGITMAGLLLPCMVLDWEVDDCVCVPLGRLVMELVALLGTLEPVDADVGVDAMDLDGNTASDVVVLADSDATTTVGVLRKPNDCRVAPAAATAAATAAAAAVVAAEGPMVAAWIMADTFGESDGSDGRVKLSGC